MVRILSPKHSGRFDWKLPPGTYVVGRDPEVNLVVDDSTVSRRHARIEVLDARTVRLTDLGSLNGTFVNDRRMTTPVDLNPGDAVTFGSVPFVITAGDAPPRPAEAVGSATIVQEDHTSLASLPIEKALEPMTFEDYAGPRILKAFSDMARMLIVPQGVDEMCGEALDLLQEIVGTSRAAVFLSRGGPGEEIALVAHRLSDRQGSAAFTIPRSIVREVLEKKNAVLFSDLVADDRFAAQQSIVASGIRSAMAVPLVNEQRILGILYTDTTDPWQRFTEESLKVTASFGNILAAKIINQELLRERQEKVALERELDIASQIQAGLMPQVLPSVPGYGLHTFQAQCKMVGGDLYDLAVLPDGRLLVLLADVSGKGMGAALLASTVLSAFRILRDTPALDPVDATKRVSRELHLSSRPGDFATAFLALLDPVAHTLTWVNAGHNPPLLLRKGGALEKVDATGVPLGMFPEWDYEVGTLSLGPGDRLIAFTDGVCEAMDPQGGFYSDERLEALVQAQAGSSLADGCKTVMDDVTRFAAEAPRSDDITMIWLEREG
jgi:phosphoserine phosphatase RsbU/P